ncbi:MAG TPA: M15 family metallopeptidase, partial [Acidimicrobiales bacterium]|nr:M15 family metallopeptidase [Acidimicrobiales bacterium]
VDALSKEFAAVSEGSTLREIVPLLAGESFEAWERRVSSYPVVLVVDGVNFDPVGRETRRFNGESAAHRVVFDVSGSAIRERFTPMRLVSEFHQAPGDHSYTMKFASYFCIGATQLAIEVDDTTSEVDANAFLRSPHADTNFFHHFGLASHRVTLQTAADAVLHPGSGVVFDWRPGPLLARVPSGLDPFLEQGDPVPRHPGLPTKLVDCEARAEPLVPIEGVRCVDAYHQLGHVDAPRTFVAREEVARRIVLAQASLPPGFTLVVLDAWRSPELQRQLSEMYREQHGPDADVYVADPSSETMRPPHVVGAALDLTLAYGGRPLALGSAYDEFSEAAHLDAFEGADSTVRRLRRLMAKALTGAGFAPYPFEWWHWSYGDDVWAVYAHQDALYEVVTGPP